MEQKAATQTSQPAGKSVELGAVEHLTALAAGALLMGIGMTRKGIPGFLAKMGGAALLVRGAAGYEPIYRALGAQLAKVPSPPTERAVRVESAVEINRSAEDLYKLWRDFENLPSFMSHLLDVQILDGARSKWIAQGPAGTIVQWEAEIVNDKKNELIAWQTIEGSSVDHAGSVHFEPLSEGGTRLRIVLSYNPPGDRFGAVIAKFLHGDPQVEIDQDLNRFAKVMNGLSRAEEKAKMM